MAVVATTVGVVVGCATVGVAGAVVVGAATEDGVVVEVEEVAVILGPGVVVVPFCVVVLPLSVSLP